VFVPFVKTTATAPFTKTPLTNPTENRRRLGTIGPPDSLTGVALGEEQSRSKSGSGLALERESASGPARSKVAVD